VLAILPGRQCGFVTPSRMFTMTTRRIAIHLLTCAACMWAAASAQASVPSSFIGVSLEYSGNAPYYDVNPGRFEQLIRGLSPNPVIRIGGDSSGVTDADMLTPDWLAMVKDTSDATNASLIMDLNLRHPELIQDEASKLANGLTRIVALEIGNEPERLSRSGARPPGYSPDDYVAEARSDWAPDPKNPLPKFSPPRRVPHGVTLIGKLFDEATMGRAGIALERAFGVVNERPAGFAG